MFLDVNKSTNPSILVVLNFCVLGSIVKGSVSSILEFLLVLVDSLEVLVVLLLLLFPPLNLASNFLIKSL